MSRWADWFPIDGVEAAKFLEASRHELDPDRSVLQLLQPWLDRMEDLPLHVAMDKAWEPIHRCLTGDLGATYELDLEAGSSPLNLCVLGGEHLLVDSNRSCTLVLPEGVAALATALAAVTKAWFSEQFFALPDNQFHEIDDESFEWAWEYFQLLPPFFAAAERTGSSVVCTISH